MARYRKKPVEVEAWKVGSDPKPDWVKVSIPYPDDGMCRLTMTDGFVCEIGIGSYIIKHGNQYRYVYSGDFEQEYEEVS